MIKTLSTYILPPHPSQSIQTLLSQTRQISSKIETLQHKIDQIPIPQFEGLSKQQKLQKIQKILQKSQEQLSQEYQALQKQKLILGRLVQFVTKYLESSQDLRVMQGNHLGLVALLQQAEKEADPEPQINKMRVWVDKIRQSLQKKLCDLVGVFSTHIRIKQKQIQILSDMLTQEIVRQFSKSLTNTIFEYDAPTFSYILRVPQQLQNEHNQSQPQNIVFHSQRKTIILKSQQSQKYFPQILKAIIKTKQIYRVVQKSLPQNLAHVFVNATQKSLQYLKSQFEYILPYLSLHHRKQIIQHLQIRNPSQLTLYDILVKLRLKGQDGQMMQSNIHQLVQKIKSNIQLMDQVILFLEICQNQGKILNIGFYVCEQLLEKLDGVVGYAVVERLLGVREDMRFKIHHPQ